MYYNINFSRNYPRVVSYNFSVDLSKLPLDEQQALLETTLALKDSMSSEDAERLSKYVGANPGFGDTIMKWVCPEGEFNKSRTAGLLAGGGAGALGGMGAGALLGNVLTKNPMNKKRNMLIGGGIGTLGGGILGGLIGRGIASRASAQELLAQME